MGFKEGKRHLWVRLVWAVGFIFCFAYYYNIPLWGDDWFYGTVRDFQEIYTLKKSWHPGRNFTEFLHIFPSKVLGTIAGFAIGDPLKGVKIIHGLVSAAITVALYFIGSLYVAKPFRPRAQILLAFSSIYLYKFFVEFTVTSQIWGALVFSLIAWLPLAHFFLEGKLPPWFERNLHGAMGLWLALIYAGTQVFDLCAWLIAGFSVFTLFYLYLNRKTLDYPHKKYAAYLASAIILLTLFALCRDTLFSTSGQVRLLGLGLRYDWIFQLHHYVKATLTLGFIVFVWYSFKNIKQQFSIGADFYPWMLLASGYFILFISASVIGTYPDLSIFVIWMGLLQAASRLWNEKPLALYYFLPTLLLGLFVGGVNNFTRPNDNIQNISRRSFITQRINERTIALYQRAEAEGKDRLEISKSLADSMPLVFRAPSPWLEYMSIWMQMYGYTEKVLPVVIVEDAPKTNK